MSAELEHDLLFEQETAIADFIAGLPPHLQDHWLEVGPSFKSRVCSAFQKPWSFEEIKQASLISKEEVEKLVGIKTEIYLLNKEAQQACGQDFDKQAEFVKTKRHELEQNSTLSEVEKEIKAIALAALTFTLATDKQPFSMQLLATLRGIEGSKQAGETEKQKTKGVVLEIKGGEGKSYCTVPLLVLSLSLLQDKPIYVHTIDPYLTVRDAARFQKMATLSGLAYGLLENAHSGKVFAGLEEKSGKRNEVLQQKVVFGRWHDFIHGFLFNLREGKEGEPVFPTNALTIIDEVDHILEDEESTPAIIIEQEELPVYLQELYDQLCAELAPAPGRWFKAKLKAMANAFKEKYSLPDNFSEKEKIVCALIKFIMARVDFIYKENSNNPELELVEERKGFFALSKRGLTDLSYYFWQKFYKTKGQTDEDFVALEKRPKTKPMELMFGFGGAVAGLWDAFSLPPTVLQQERRQEKQLVLPSKSAEVIQAICLALSLRKDVDYFVDKQQRLQIISQITGYPYENRQFQSLLQLVLYIKEDMPLYDSLASKAVDSLTVQGFYEQFCGPIIGLTATALPAAKRLEITHQLKTIIVPPQFESQRKDKQPLVLAQAPREKDWHQTLAPRLFHPEKANLLVLNSTPEAYQAGAAVLKHLAELGQMQISELEMSLAIHTHQNPEAAEIIFRQAMPGMVVVSAKTAGRGIDPSEGQFYSVFLEPTRSARLDEQRQARVGRRGEAGQTRMIIHPSLDLWQILSLREQDEIKQLCQAYESVSPGEQEKIAARLEAYVAKAQTLWEDSARSQAFWLSVFEQPLLMARQRLLMLRPEERQSVLENWPEFMDFIQRVWRNGFLPFRPGTYATIGSSWNEIVNQQVKLRLGLE